ncbi:hypothetical protein [Mycobacterium conspicuum]|jgi:hypothetical protein|uniref:Uncharacterized protein n=1 Tax=Mycobacterium conspicuum TaxID=44010 RepID=A0A1X1TI70_9MYCO|nr:hypothetical protein [Mycobacterium conspicuum]ORV44285.1 hypothetical protein AWC00_07470 [Mycobacterium conspicuum]BBZ42641.1 hypothetical protein MCNS_57040 [Mycobacterium conspicuum]
MNAPLCLGHPEVNPTDYPTYSAYGTTGSHISEAAASLVRCWGALPGTSHNVVGVSYPDGAATLLVVKPLPPHGKVTYNGSWTLR